MNTPTNLNHAVVDRDPNDRGWYITHRPPEVSAGIYYLNKQGAWDMGIRHDNFWSSKEEAEKFVAGLRNPTLQLEAGKRYVTAGGEVTTPLTRDEQTGLFLGHLIATSTIQWFPTGEPVNHGNESFRLVREAKPYVPGKCQIELSRDAAIGLPGLVEHAEQESTPEYAHLGTMVPIPNFRNNYDNDPCAGVYQKVRPIPIIDPLQISRSFSREMRAVMKSAYDEELVVDSIELRFMEYTEPPRFDIVAVARNPKIRKERVRSIAEIAEGGTHE